MYSNGTFPLTSLRTLFAVAAAALVSACATVNPSATDSQSAEDAANRYAQWRAEQNKLNAAVRLNADISVMNAFCSRADNDGLKEICATDLRELYVHYKNNDGLTNQQAFLIKAGEVVYNQTERVLCSIKNGAFDCFTATSNLTARMKGELLPFTMAHNSWNIQSPDVYDLNPTSASLFSSMFGADLSGASAPAFAKIDLFAQPAAQTASVPAPHHHGISSLTTKDSTGKLVTLRGEQLDKFLTDAANKQAAEAPLPTFKMNTAPSFAAQPVSPYLQPTANQLYISPEWEGAQKLAAQERAAQEREAALEEMIATLTTETEKKTPAASQTPLPTFTMNKPLDNSGAETLAYLTPDTDVLSADPVWTVVQKLAAQERAQEIAAQQKALDEAVAAKLAEDKVVEPTHTAQPEPAAAPAPAVAEAAPEAPHDDKVLVAVEKPTLLASLKEGMAGAWASIVRAKDSLLPSKPVAVPDEQEAAPVEVHQASTVSAPKTSIAATTANDETEDKALAAKIAPHLVADKAEAVSTHHGFDPYYVPSIVQEALAEPVSSAVCTEEDAKLLAAAEQDPSEQMSKTSVVTELKNGSLSAQGKDTADWLISQSSPKATTVDEQTQPAAPEANTPDDDQKQTATGIVSNTLSKLKDAAPEVAVGAAASLCTKAGLGWVCTHFGMAAAATTVPGLVGSLFVPAALTILGVGVGLAACGASALAREAWKNRKNKDKKLTWKSAGETFKKGALSKTALWSVGGLGALTIGAELFAAVVPESVVDAVVDPIKNIFTSVHDHLAPHAPVDQVGAATQAVTDQAATPAVADVAPASAPDVAPTAPAVTEQLSSATDAVAAYPADDVRSLLSADELKSLPKNIQDLAKSGKPADLARFCKEASFQLINHTANDPDAAQAGFNLVKKGLEIAQSHEIPLETYMQLKTDDNYLSHIKRFANMALKVKGASLAA